VHSGEAGNMKLVYAFGGGEVGLYDKGKTLG